MRPRVPARVPVLPRRLVLKEGETPADALFGLLREMARSGRMAQDRTFYSLREIATRFQLPLSLVNRVFARLEKEGLIAKIRGSRTILPGRKYDRHFYIRGVIGIPVSIFRFSAFADYREFVLVLRRKLRRHHFMPAAVFYERDQNRADFLSERLFDAKADHVLWFSPRNAPAAIVPILRDAGVPVTGVADSSPTTIPCRYRIDREEALRLILREWRGAGLTSTVVMAVEREASPAAEEHYHSVSAEELLPSKIVTLKQADSRRALRQISTRQARGVLLTAAAASFLALQEPESLAALTKERRVALIEGPVGVW
ncbi:MAG TPA: hypothetical protein VGK72_07790, partial [Chthoniobacterales bacterium]